VKRSTRAAVVPVAVALLSAVSLPGTAAFAAEDPVHVVASGFAGPLHVAVAPDGSLLDADAFLGAIDRVDPGTGAVTKVTDAPGFSPGVGVKGGQVYFTLSQGEEETTAAALFRWTEDEGVTQVADMLAWEMDKNPDGQPHVDDAASNPYAVLALPGRVIVADAAGNDLVEVRSNGAMRTLTRFPVSFKGDCATATNNGVPNGGCDPTPTDVKLGPDGFLYVSGLGGEAEGHIWKVNATTGQIVEHHDGFPPFTGIAVGNDGSLYAASLFTGQVFRLSHGDVTVAQVSESAGPTGLAMSRTGTLYAGVLDFGENPGSIVSIAPSAFH
jgi:streptogramin lyase